MAKTGLAPLSALLSPIKIGALTLPNRVVMAPLTRNRADEADAPHALNALYYAQRASAGLIVSEASQISPVGKGYPRTPGNYSAAQIAGWKQVTDAVHAKGGRIVLQLWHVGRISHPSLQPNGGLPVAPSGIKPAGEAFTDHGLQPFVTPRALATEEIPGIVAQYAQAARNAQTAGFDGVEIHAANGYLIDQFLRDGSNHRTDQYGGSLENRSRFLREIVEAVIAAWSPDRVGVRISPGGDFNDMRDSDPTALGIHVAELLNRYGLAYLHMLEDNREKWDYRAVRKYFNGPYIANRGYTAETAEAAIESGEADLVSFGVPFIANPDLVERFAKGAALAEGDQNLFYGGGERGYADYPSLVE
jgi:N-ethylmaleimide reductase